MGNTVELPSELAACFAGSHAFGVRDTDRIAITIEKGGARFLRAGAAVARPEEF
jgi:hypothetical protein